MLQPRDDRRASRGADPEAGFTLVEVLAALLLLTVALFALATTLDFSRASTDQSELKAAAIDRAQREIEAIRSLPYDQVAHPAGGILAPAIDDSDPTSRIGSGGFAWSRPDPALVEPLVTAAQGVVAMRQEIPATDVDRFAFTIWRFVTWTDDPACTATTDCPDADGEYRRVTVVVRASGLGDTLAPVWSSTTVIDPLAAANNSAIPATLCHDETGDLVLCSQEVEGAVHVLYLTNTSAAATSVRQPIPADPAQRALHKTVFRPPSCTVGSATGCPVPDLMVGDALDSLEADDPGPDQVSFSTDVVPSVDAGRPLLRDGTCALGPSPASDRHGVYWVSPPLADRVELTGQGELRLYSHTVGDGVGKDVTLCAAVYDAPATVANPVAHPPVEIGRFAGTFSWPGQTAPVTARFTLGGAHDLAVGRRIGLRLWVAAASDDDVVLLYDHPLTESSVSLLAKEET